MNLRDNLILCMLSLLSKNRIDRCLFSVICFIDVDVFGAQSGLFCDVLSFQQKIMMKELL